MTDRNAFLEKLYIQYHDDLKKYCARLVKYDRKYFSTIDDCVQDAFYKATLFYDRISASPNPYGWLAICCQNYYRDFFRKYYRRSNIAGVAVSLSVCAELADPLDSVMRWNVQQEALETLGELFLELTPTEQRVYYEYFVKGQSMAKVAQKIPLKFNSVRGAVTRIRRKSWAKHKAEISGKTVHFRYDTQYLRRGGTVNVGKE